MRKSLPALLCAFTPFLLGQALADDLQMETVIVSANRLSQPAASTSLSIGSVDSETLQLIGHVHISDALARIPGTWISRGNGQEHLTAIRSPVLTGGGSCGAFYMAEDGIPLRAPGFCNVNQLFDANTEQAGAIEVIRGPGTAVHGSNALNGVINVLSRAPAESRQAELSLEGGPHDYARAKVSLSDGTEHHRVRLSANGAHDGGYKDDSGYDQQKLSLRYDYQGDGWRARSLLTSTNLNQETAGYVQGLGAYKDSRLKDSNPNPEAYRDTRSSRFYTRFEKDGSEDSLLVITPYLRYTEMDFLQHFLPGTPLEQNGQKSAGLQATFYRPGSDIGRVHHGFDIDVTNAYLKESQATATFTNFGTTFPTGKHYDYQVDTINAAWFIGSETEFDSGAQLNAGARYELQRYNYDNRMVDGNTLEDGTPCAGCRYTRPSDGTDKFYNWSAYLGYIQPLNDNVDLTLHASHGFRPPQASELYRLQNGQPKASLDSEELNSLEAGLRGNWQRVQYQLGVYAMKKRNIIIQDSQRQNIDDSQTLHRGLELSLNWQMCEQLAFAFQGSYSKQQYDKTVDKLVKGLEIDTAPRTLAAAQLRWQPLQNSLIELEWQHIGDYYLTETEGPRYPGHNLLHLHWRQQLTPQLHSVLRIQNLSDEDYADRADYAFGSYRYFVGEPRSVFLELGLAL